MSTYRCEKFWSYDWHRRHLNSPVARSTCYEVQISGVRDIRLHCHVFMSFDVADQQEMGGLDGLWVTRLVEKIRFVSLKVRICKGE